VAAMMVESGEKHGIVRRGVRGVCVSANIKERVCECESASICENENAKDKYATSAAGKRVVHACIAGKRVVHACARVHENAGSVRFCRWCALVCSRGVRD
jgi:hypothetical protein